MIAFGAPRRAATRRGGAPRAIFGRISARAARRNASAARFAPGRVRDDGGSPPDRFGSGASPSHAPNFFALAHRLVSVPASPSTASAVPAPAPPIAARPTPAASYGRRRAPKRGSLPCRLREWPLPAPSGAGPSGNAVAAGCASAARSHAATRAR